jgi:hypothetical protein
MCYNAAFYFSPMLWAIRIEFLKDIVMFTLHYAALCRITSQAEKLEAKADRIRDRLDSIIASGYRTRAYIPAYH